MGGENAVNTLYGDAEIILSSACGDDILTGGVGQHANYLFGDAQRMRSESSGGDDRLISAAGTTDHMYGDAEIIEDSTGGADVFEFRKGNGHDFIYDFRNGEDLIELAGFFKANSKAQEEALDHMPARVISKTLESYKDLNIQVFDSNADGLVDSSIIIFDDSNSVSVLGVTDLTASDFHFLA